MAKKFKNTKPKKVVEAEPPKKSFKDFWLVVKTIVITLFVVAFAFELYMHTTLRNAHQSLLDDLKSGCYIVADESTVEQLKNQDFAMLDIIKIDQREE